MAGWQQAVLDERAWRNDLYLGADTPLAPESRARFKGLAWWPLDARFRTEGARLVRHQEPLAGRLAATGPDAIELLEVGAIDFTLLGARCRLLAYAPAPGESEEDYLLIPFRDGTTGKETYGAGRYLDLEPDPRDAYTLDFNRAYHPYCAYDDAWACALPPRENTLGLRIEAGERL